MSLRWRIAQWFELRWWQRYFAGRDKAQYYSWKRQYWQNLVDGLADVLPIASAHNIADLGCGPAGIFTIFDDKAVTALDPLLDTYEATLSFFRKSDFPYTTFTHQKLEDYKPIVKHDVVFCMNAINHVADINVAYDRLVGTTKDGGYVVVSIDAHNYSFFKWLFCLIPGDILHPHQYDLAEYCQFMTERRSAILKTQLIKSEFYFTHYVIVAMKDSHGE